MPDDTVTIEAFEHHKAGRIDVAEELYRAALDANADNLQALQLLGTLALRSGKPDEAVVVLERAVAVLQRSGEEEAKHASLYNNLGIALRMTGRSVEAAAIFKHGLTLDPNLAELHAFLGRAAMEKDDFTDAVGHYETAMSINANLPPECLCDLGTAYARSGRLEEAVGLYRRVLTINPAHRAARLNLAQMLRRTEKHDESIGLLTQLLQETPDNLTIVRQLGVVYMAANNQVLSLACFMRILAQNPDDAEALQYVANIQQAQGKSAEAEANYRKSLALKPLITIDATQSPPAFRALLIFAPGAGNTPADYLMDRAAYEINILNLLPDAEYDADMLRGRGDVIVNLISDVDQGQTMMAPALALIDRIGKPVVNHPRKILQTDRCSIARILEPLPDCVVPRTLRFTGSALRAEDFDPARTPFVFPFLARLTGTHGGTDFEKINDKAELDAFVARCPDADYYLTNYVDYRSADGFFRKYRFIFVNGEVLPYHLAIDEKWKIHHVTTDMANQAWMQEEEKTFLETPHTVFNPRQYKALRAIQQAVGLEYFGIDCGLDQDGRVVVFEVNASMLVHQHNEQFPYKIEPVLRIKTAFNDMLKRMAKCIE